MEPKLQAVYSAIVDGNPNAARDAVAAALEAGFAPDVVLNEAMVTAMAEVGRLFEEGEYYVPEMLIAARAMQGGLVLIKPLLVQDNVQSAGKIVIGTVKGDMHDIGKNLVAMMLEGAAFEVIDLGTDVTPERFVEAAREHNANVVAMSALLTTTMANMKATIEALQNAGVREQVKVVVGGAPLTADYARQIGADGYAPDASRAVAMVRGLIG